MDIFLLLLCEGETINFWLDKVFVFSTSSRRGCCFFVLCICWWHCCGCVGHCFWIFTLPNYFRLTSWIFSIPSMLGVVMMIIVMIWRWEPLGYDDGLPDLLVGWEPNVFVIRNLKGKFSLKLVRASLLMSMLTQICFHASCHVSFLSGMCSSFLLGL